MLNKIYFLTVLLIMALSSFLVAEIEQGSCESQILKTHVNNTKWTISDLGTLSLFDEADFKECNSNGQVLIFGHLKPYDFMWMFWDSRLGLISIPTSKGDWNQWLRINGKGLVLGVNTKRSIPFNSSYQDLITWSPEQGYRMYQAQFPTKKAGDVAEFLARCRNSELAVINQKADSSEDNQVLVLQNNQLTNLTPSLRKQAQALGFDAGGWTIFEVNSKGSVLGKFKHYEKHPHKNKKMEVSTHFFMREGDNFYLVDWPEGFPANWSCIDTPLWIGGDKFEFTSTGNVLFSWAYPYDGRDSMMWSPDEGLTKLEVPYFISELAKKEGASDARPICLLDDDSMVWLISYEYSSRQRKYFICEKNGNYYQWFLPVDINGKPRLENSDDYPGLEFKQLNSYFLPLFQKKIGFVQVDWLGESHPFIIEINQ